MSLSIETLALAKKYTDNKVKDIGGSGGDVTELTDRVTKVESNISNIDKEVDDIKTNVDNTTKDIANIKEDIKTANDKITQNSTQINEIKTNTSNLSSEVADISSQSEIISTEKGESISLTDSANAKIREIALFGKSTQETTTGAQLLNLDASNVKLSSGTNYSFEDDLLIVTSENASYGRIYIDITDIVINNAGKSLYLKYDSIDTSTSNNGTTDLSIEYKDDSKMTYFGMENPYVIPKDVSNISRIYMRFISNNSTENTNTYTLKVYKPMLSFDEDSTYEPYTGGQASPNPDYPQEITSVENPSVEVAGKNLFDGKLLQGSVNSSGEFYSIQNRIVTENYIKVDIRQYVASVNLANRIGISFYDESKKYVSFSGWNENTYKFIPNQKGYVKIIFKYGDDRDLAVDADYKIQIELGDTATSYEPYKPIQTAKIDTTMRGIPVTSGGNYTDENGQQWICDELRVLADGSGKIVRNVGVEKLTANKCTSFNDAFGSLGNYVIMSLEQHFVGGIDIPVITNIAKSVSFDQRTQSNIFRCYINDISNKSFCFRDKADNTIVTSLVAFKEYLNDNDVYALVALATPVEEELTKEQVTEFLALQTYKPNTNISNDQNAGMEITYVCDTKNYIDNKFNELATALVASK